MAQQGRDLLAGAMLILLVGFGWIQTAGLSASARMFPRLALGLLGVLSLVYIARTLLRHAGEAAAEPFFTHPGRFAVGLGLMAGFGFGMTRVGFFTAALVFIPAFAAALGLRRPVLLAVAATGFVAAVHLVFVVGLRRPLPPDLLVGLLAG